MRRKLVKAMGNVKDLAVYESKLNAPIDEGHLTQDITGSVKENAKSVSAVVYVPHGAESSEYAVAMHENHYNLGKHSKEKQEKDPAHTVGKENTLPAPLKTTGKKSKKYIEEELKL
ncbi:MAG: hypothetical protein V8T87_10120 [Victivallales bacterium]